MTDQRPTPIIGSEGMASPPQVGAQISAVEKKGDEAIASVRREMGMNWVAHQRQHEQEQDAVDKAVVTMDKRLDGLNELRAAMSDRDKFFATITGLDETNKRLDRSEIDTRQRFEAMERRLNELATAASREAQAQGRAGQDLRVGQDSTRYLVGVALVVLGIIITVAIYLANTTT